MADPPYNDFIYNQPKIYVVLFLKIPIKTEL